MRKCFFAAAAFMVLYLALYAAAWNMKIPAANMAYFVYAENDQLDQACYVGFFPIYWIQSRVLHLGPKHNRDRELLKYPPDFNG